MADISTLGKWQHKGGAERVQSLCVMELMSLGCEVHMYLREYYNTVHTTNKKEIFIFVHKWFKLVQHSNVIVYLPDSSV